MRWAWWVWLLSPIWSLHFFFQYNFAYKKSAYVGQSSNEVLSRVWNDILRFSGRFWHLFRFQEHRGLLCGHSGDLWTHNLSSVMTPRGEGHMCGTLFSWVYQGFVIPLPPKPVLHSILFLQRKCARKQVSRVDIVIGTTLVHAIEKVFHCNLG